MVPGRFRGMFLIGGKRQSNWKTGGKVLSVSLSRGSDAFSNESGHNGELRGELQSRAHGLLTVWPKQAFTILPVRLREAGQSELQRRFQPADSVTRAA